MRNISATLIPLRNDFPGAFLAIFYPLALYIEYRKVPAIYKGGMGTTVYNSHYLWYALLWLQPAIKGNAGAVFESINKATIELLKIPVPSLEEQRRIVAVLDEAFEGLDRARAHAEANLQNAGELFASIANSLVLGNGDATNENVFTDNNLQLRVEEICSEGGNGKSRNPKFFGKRGVPRLPEGWAWSFPEHLCSHIVDCLHSTPKWSSDGEICLRTTNFRRGEVDLSEVRYVSSETFAQRTKRLARFIQRRPDDEVANVA